MEYTKQEFQRYVGNPSQVSGIRELCFAEGRMRGSRLWEVRAGNGLAFELLPDKCLDIGMLSYKGINISWASKTGPCSAPFASPVPGEFVRYFGGGMLWTCGMKNTGGAFTSKDGEFISQHGRIGITPAEQAWKHCGFVGDDYVLKAGAIMREAALCGYNLTLTRTITTSMNKAEIDICDTLENHEPEATDYLVLYHYNFGFPFIDRNLRMDFGQPASPMQPRGELAAQGAGQWNSYTEPVDGYEEQCFFHDLTPQSSGLCEAKLENPALGIGVRLSYDKSTLPVLTQWKYMRTGEYVLGVEPGNSYLRGLEKEREAGQVGRIEAYGKLTFHTKLSFYDL